jgi:hypothetical protein
MIIDLAGITSAPAATFAEQKSTAAKRYNTANAFPTRLLIAILFCEKKLKKFSGKPFRKEKDCEKSKREYKSQ